MYKYIALTALVLGSAALGFNINRGGEEQFTLALVEIHPHSGDQAQGVLDIDQDGLVDLLRVDNEIANDVYFELQARMNLGDMSFSPWETLGTYELDLLPESTQEWTWTRVGKVSDMNGDALPDLVLGAEAYDDSVPDGVHATLYLINNGSGGFTCAGDVTDDGRTNVDDLLGVIGDWGCTEEGLPD